MPVAPYGSWTSPITAALITQGTVSLGNVALDGGDRYWTESRPQEKGRTTLLCQRGDGPVEELTPAPWNVRTRAHEYGGGAFTVSQGVVVFSHDRDQRLYRLHAGGTSQPLTVEADLKFGDGLLDLTRQRWIGVREDHRPAGEPQDAIVAVPLAGEPGEGDVLVSGADFYSSPRLSPDGRQLAWIAWHHPRMPWDGTELWLADLDAHGRPVNARCIAGGPTESVFQPEWSPEGCLGFVSDRSGWWNLYRWDGTTAQPLCPRAAEFGLPQWVFGMRTWGWADENTIVCSYTEGGLWYLARLDLSGGGLQPYDLPFTEFNGLVVAGDRALVTAAAPDRLTELVELEIASGQWRTLARSGDLPLDSGYLARPESLAFPTPDGAIAYALYYPPTNRDFTAAEGELPPLLVKSHSGPTAQTRTGLNLSLQFWTSRGFGVLDVNYGGSTGYGRAYRERLNGQWGVVDVQDCAAGARWLVEQGRVDGDRLCIDGGSAGGYTTLCALTFTDLFRAGASRYGVSDPAALAQDTHKFEARYLDTLIGPWPEAQDLYAARSPLHHVARLNCPVIFFQGLEDRVVPPDQAERMFRALRDKGIPTAYLTFPEEGHSFRQAATIQRALEAELAFFARIFGFIPADAIEPLAIANLN
jgi:dipeptidyl aminopeptidase/acylaminoacyl peptidase